MEVHSFLCRVNKITCWGHKESKPIACTLTFLESKVVKEARMILSHASLATFRKLHVCITNCASF